MEKASTPRNRLTRSSAKQVNTPKNVETEETVERNTEEEIKHNTVRKTRRRYDTKAKTNGDTTNIENKSNNEDTVENNIGDGGEKEELNSDINSQDSFMSIIQKTPSPKVSKRSIRTRRSITPGPELESNASEKMKRSSSFGKLDSVLTPTKKRGRRSKSESKDFVFTPTKDKQSISYDTNGKYIPNVSSRIIEKIEEDNEEEKLGEDEKKTLTPEEKSSDNLQFTDVSKVTESVENKKIDESSIILELKDEDEVIDSVTFKIPANESELKPVSETSVKETELSTQEVNDSVIINDPSSENVKSGDPLKTDTCDHDSVLLSGNTTKRNETEETNSIMDTEENESKKEPCPLHTEIEKPVNTTAFEENVQLESGSPAKETLQINQLQSESVVNKLVDTSKEENSEESVIKDEISKNTHSELQTDVEIHEIVNYDKVEIVKKSEDNQISIELVDDDDDDDDDDDSDTLFETQLNDQLKRIMDEGMEGSDNDNAELEPLNDNSEGKSDQKQQNEIENSEISNIDLVNTDSEDSDIEDKSKNSTVIECKDSDHENDTCKLTPTENENITTYELENMEKCTNDSLKEQVEIEAGEEDTSDIVKQKEDQITECKISDDYNYPDYDKEIETNCKNEDTKSDLPINTTTISDQCEYVLVVNKPTIKIEEKPSLDTEQSKSLNIKIESVQGSSTLDGKEKVFQDSVKSSNLDQDQDLDDKDRLVKNKMNYGSSSTLNNQETNESVMLDNTLKLESMDNYDEDDEDEELNKSDEGSCDIYKGLSDSNSYADEKEGSQFGESQSSEMQSRSGGDSEEDVTSADEDDVKEKTRLINQLCDTMNLKTKEVILSKGSEKTNDKNPDSPMTYDKALAIINQNRVRKIDDEEFFDMFTEELNKVSEQSGSDSDIAIVDEYLMEPEEPAKKTQQKSSNVQNAKQPPRQYTGPGTSSQSMPPERYPESFNQPIHNQHGNVMNQHGHPMPSQTNNPMQRGNFTQDSMYQQYDQNMHIRGQLMYNQYGHPTSSMQDPHNMFNPPMTHPDINYSTGMYSHPHPLCPVSESSFPSTNPSLKIRTVTDMNSTSLSLTHKNYSSSDQAAFNASPEGRTFERQEDQNNYVNLNSSTVSEAPKVDTGSAKDNGSEIAKPHLFSQKKSVNSRTPILDLLGLDEKALKLLKKVLGLNSIKRKLTRYDPDWRKKCLERNIWKSELRQRGRKKETRYRNIRQRESDSSSIKFSSEQSSEESSVTSSCFLKGRNHGSSSENENRKVNVEDDNVYVTVKTKRELRHRNKKPLSFKKPCLSSLKERPETTQEKKTNFQWKPRKKMIQKQSTVVKSQCGIFTVDPLTASSQSSDSEVETFDDHHQVQEFKRKMKSDLASGKNKLSNMFKQRSFEKTKQAKKKASKPVEKIKGPLQKEYSKESRKLPTEILETLAKEDKKNKRHRVVDSGSDDVLEQPKKMRKKSQKMKVKSEAADQNYIPFVTGGATEFGLSRLDKDAALTLAEKAANFRTDQLYGGAVKRITIMDFKHQWC